MRRSMVYEGTLHIYSYRAIIEMDKRNQLWLFCICTYTLAQGAASPSLSNGTSFQVCCLHLCPGTRAPLGRGDGRAASLRKDDLTQMSAAPPHLNIKTKYSFLIFLSACLLLLCFEHDQEKPRHRFKKLQIDKLDINSDVFEELA